MQEILTTPLTKEKVKTLKAGDVITISGTIYSARDAAHKRMIESLNKGEDIPFDIRDQIIYYVGPCPEKPGQVIGSAGPTTSSRMDKYAPELIKRGLTGMIGKGYRSQEVIDAMKEYGAVYFAAIGGAGALIANCIVSQEVIDYEDLGPEAIRKLVVKELPVIVVIDCYGNNLYQSEREKYRKEAKTCTM